MNLLQGILPPVLTILHLFRKYLSDPTEDVRVATETILADFLRETRDVTVVRKRSEEQAKSKQDSEPNEQPRRPDTDKESLPDITLGHSERAAFISENDVLSNDDSDLTPKDDPLSESDYRDTGGRSYMCSQ